MVVTIKDIARAAGVTHSTVSRALSGNPAIPAHTTERIRLIASELGYVPSAVARGLKTSRSRVLGVIVTRIDDPFFGEILQAIEDVFQEIGYSLFVAASNRDFQREKAIVQTMLEHRVDGLIICSTQFGEQHVQLLKQYGFPIVAIGNSEITAVQHLVSHNDFEAFCQVTKHLIELGHQRIAFLGDACAPLTTQGRLNGFLHEMQVAHLPVPGDYIFHSPNDQLGSGKSNLDHFWALPEPPTAVACFNDVIAIGLIKAMTDAGLQIPRDCSVTGFDDISFAAYASPPLTTFEQPKYLLGHNAAQMMVRLLQPSGATGLYPENILILSGRLVVRQSTVSPRQKF